VKNILLLTPSLRKKLKKPIGVLIKGSFNETLIELQEFISREKPAKIITVGDAVTESCIKNNLKPNISIIDNKIMRRSIQPIKMEASVVFQAKNPAGAITEEAWRTIKKAISMNSDTKIIIEGEEDLLTLIVILEAPENTIVLYGQPNQGIVLVNVTKEKKKEIKEIINAMIHSKD
jgi:uncharacterized protein (UPF0218 family)